MYAAAGKTVTHTEIADMEIRDNASVVLYALGCDQPDTWTGRVPSGLFEGVRAAERPVYVMPVSEKRLHESVPTPAPEELTKVIGAERILAYLPFDGDPSDALGKTKTEAHGKLYFLDGYFGKGMRTDDGYVTLCGAELGERSFTAAFWLKTEGVPGDPAVFSNKNWQSGMNPGFALSLDSGSFNFNFSDGKHRQDFAAPLPPDYRQGWVYVTAVVDREAGEVRLSTDFGAFRTFAFSDELKNASFQTPESLNIGQDGTGKYRPIPAELDEFLLVGDALTDEDLKALKAHYRA